MSCSGCGQQSGGTKQSTVLRLPCTSAFSRFLLFAVETSIINTPESVTYVSLEHGLIRQDVHRHEFRGAVYVYLCNFAPTVSCISHRLEPLLLRWRPRRIGPTLLHPGFLRRLFNVGVWDSGRSRSSSRLGRHLTLRQAHRLSLSRVSRCRRLCKGAKGLLPLTGRGGGLEAG